MKKIICSILVSAALTGSVSAVDGAKTGFWNGVKSVPGKTWNFTKKHYVTVPVGLLSLAAAGYDLSRGEKSYLKRFFIKSGLVTKATFKKYPKTAITTLAILALTGGLALETKREESWVKSGWNKTKSLFSKKKAEASEAPQAS